MKPYFPLCAWLGRTAAITVVALMLLAPSPAAATLRYDLQLYGLVCGLCADGLERNFQALASDVADVEVDLEAGHATFVTTGNSIIDPEELRQVVLSVGFDPRALTLTATGTLSGTPDALRLSIDEHASIRLGPGPALESVRTLFTTEPGPVTISGTLSGSGESLHLHVVEVNPS